MFTCVNYTFFTFVNMRLSYNFYKSIFDSHSSYKCALLFGRYLSESILNKVNHQLSHHLKIKNEGNSVESRVITSYNIGHGPIKILIWSQMHGNESTSTKAIYDFLNLIRLDLPQFKELKDLLNHLSLKIIPVLNPDGAQEFTRVNANQVDLNRDAELKSQPETQILFSIIDEFKPSLCFNMHGQRTIFSVGDTDRPATLSFLSASSDSKRSVTPTRLKSMAVINEINDLLTSFIPGQIGRYDDAFNINCTGDYLHAKQIPTVLFESGHFKDDYEREKVRVFTLLSFIKALEASTNFSTNNEQLVPKKYLEIPENKKLFYDVIIKQLAFNNTYKDMGVMYQEQLENYKLAFFPIVSEISNHIKNFGHLTLDSSQFDQSLSLNKLKVGDKLPLPVKGENVIVKKFKI